MTGCEPAAKQFPVESIDRGCRKHGEIDSGIRVTKPRVLRNSHDMASPAGNGLAVHKRQPMSVHLEFDEFGGVVEAGSDDARAVRAERGGGDDVAMLEGIAR
jgi:hypothetical protein